MWQGFKTLTGYKDSFKDTNNTERTLVDILNHCFSFFVAAQIGPALSGKDKDIQLT